MALKQNNNHSNGVSRAVLLHSLSEKQNAVRGQPFPAPDCVLPGFISLADG